MKICFFDTESCGFIGPTLLLQYQWFEDGVLSKIFLHNIFKETAGSTCRIIEEMMKCKLIGFNLTHDIYHLSKTYNILSLMDPDNPPTILQYAYLAKTDAARRLCLLPEEPLDLMIYGQKGPFQAIMKQAPITLRRISRVLAQGVIHHLTERIHLNPLYFAGMQKGYHWDIKDLWHRDVAEFKFRQVTPEDRKKGHRRDVPLKIDPDMVDLVLPFNPKKGLKDIAIHILKLAPESTTGFKLPDHVKAPKEEFWNPNDENAWIDVIEDHIEMWATDPDQIQYATDDVTYTREMYYHFNQPEGNDDGSILACMVGNTYNKGFDFDKDKAGLLFKKRFRSTARYKKIVEYNSVPKSLAFLLKAKGLNPILKSQVTSTKAEVLEGFAALDGDLGKRATFLLRARKQEKERQLLFKMLTAGKMYVQFKITGTKTNRMSGGSMEGKGGSINPQGIPNEPYFRELFTFSNDAGMKLSGGDAASFEVVIMCKVWGDENLTKEVQSGKKFHAILGSFIYGDTYENILADPKRYGRSKSCTFGKAYGAQPKKLAATAGVTIDDILESDIHFENKYPKVRENREANTQQFQALHQPAGGGAISWREPTEYVESFLKFRRYFTVEIEVMRALYHLANNLPEDLVELGQKVKVMRRDRVQTASGACCSALYGAAFGIQGQIQRSAGNHLIQSVGGQMIKELQAILINKYQKRGIHSWAFIPFNVHDELQCSHLPDFTEDLTQEIKKYENSYQEKLPMFKMEWFPDAKNWAEAH